MHYIYTFLNQHDVVIYVGRTNNIIRRMRNEHFTERGHLPQTCYQETVAVHYAEVNSHNEAKVYELYYIEKHQPKYNQSDIGGGPISITLDNLVWKRFNFDTDTPTKTKTQIIQRVQSFHDDLAHECHYAEQLLRDKDRAEWLTKLTQEEQNEYLATIYSFERFVRGIAEQNDRLQKEILHPNPIGTHTGIPV